MMKNFAENAYTRNCLIHMNLMFWNRNNVCCATHSRQIVKSNISQCNYVVFKLFLGQGKCELSLNFLI